MSFSTDPVLSFTLYGEGSVDDTELSKLSSQKRGFATVFEKESGTRTVEYRDTSVFSSVSYPMAVSDYLEHLKHKKCNWNFGLKATTKDGSEADFGFVTSRKDQEYCVPRDQDTE